MMMKMSKPFTGERSLSPAVADAKVLIETSKDKETQSKAEDLWKYLIEESSVRIKDNSRDLYESVTMQIDTPDVPVIYEDRSCLGSLTLGLLSYAREFLPGNNQAEFVLNYLISKVTEELANSSVFIMNNHFNLRAYLAFLSYRTPVAVSLPFKTMQTIIDEVIDAKVREIKDVIYSRLKTFERQIDDK